MANYLNRYYEILRARPGATFKEITTAYYIRVQRLAENPSPGDFQRLQEIKHAFHALKRAFTARGPVKRKKKGAWKPVLLATGMIALFLASSTFLVVINYSSLKLVLTQREVGETLRWKDRPETYGQILAFDPEHPFDIGSPSPAYEIRLTDGSGTVWVSERIVENGMVPAD